LKIDLRIFIYTNTNTGVSMKIGCVFFPRFAVQIERINDPSMTASPLVIGGHCHEKKPVYEASEEAVETGIRVGMPVREAHGLCPEAAFLPPDEERYMSIFDSILGILSSFSPFVENAGLGCAFIGLEDRSEDLRAGKRIGAMIKENTLLNAAISFGSSKFVTWASCQVIKPGQVMKIPVGREELFLSRLPLDLLPGSEEMVRRFHLLGLNTLGQIAKLPPKAIDREFGWEGRLLWELAKGIDHSKIRRWSNQQVVEEAHCLEYPAESSRQVLSSADMLLERVEVNLAKDRLCSRKWVAAFFLSNRSAVRKVFHFKNPVCSKQAMLKRLRDWLGEVAFESPVVEMKFTLSDLSPREGKQIGLLQTGGRTKTGLSSTLKSLKARFGKGVIKRAVLSDSTYVLPEESFHFVEFR
jgi:nucleotidyltransferase/DNA polymerase involved in DNA repair